MKDKRSRLVQIGIPYLYKSWISVRVNVHWDCAQLRRYCVVRVDALGPGLQYSVLVYYPRVLTRKYILGHIST